MKYPATQVARALERHAKSLSKVERTDCDPDSERYYELHQILFSTLNLLAQYRGPERVRQWIDQKHYRAKLLRLQRAPYSKDGQRAIADLFRFTVSCVHADSGFRSEVDVKDLPMPAKREATPAVHERLAKARKARADKKAESEARRQDRIAAAVL
ncbi:MAG: hypothetical protein KDA75_16280 [Planctomycetaceae bacterium]|nr:hypothetical protein [Planctomycetaceae bacterium]